LEAGEASTAAAAPAGESAFNTGVCGNAVAGMAACAAPAVVCGDGSVEPALLEGEFVAEFLSLVRGAAGAGAASFVTASCVFAEEVEAFGAASEEWEPPEVCDFPEGSAAGVFAKGGWTVWEESAARAEAAAVRNMLATVPSALTDCDGDDGNGKGDGDPVRLFVPAVSFDSKCCTTAALKSAATAFETLGEDSVCPCVSGEGTDCACDGLCEGCGADAAVLAVETELAEKPDWTPAAGCSASRADIADNVAKSGAVAERLGIGMSIASDAPVRVAPIVAGPVVSASAFGESASGEAELPGMAETGFAEIWALPLVDCEIADEGSGAEFKAAGGVPAEKLSRPADANATVVAGSPNAF
jgi:hypothetical protein